MVNNIFIWVFCGLTTITFAAKTDEKPIENAAEVYQKLFLLYPSKEIRVIEEKRNALQTSIISGKADPNLFYKKMAEWKDSPAWKLKQKVENYAKGTVPLDSEIESYIDGQKAVLDLIQQALTIENSDWPIAAGLTRNPVNEIADKCSKMKEIHLLAIAEARLEADKAQYKNALIKTLGTFRIIHQTGNLSYLEHLVCLGMEKASSDCLRDVLGQMSPDAAILKMLETQLKKENEQFPSFRECVLGEKELFPKITSKESIVDSLKIQANIDPNSIPEITDDYRQKSIDYNNHYIDQVCQVLDLPYIETLNKLEQIGIHTAKDAAVALDFTTKKVRPENILKTNALLTALSHSSLSQQYAVHMRAKSQLCAMVAALRIYQDYARTRQLPEKLPQDCPPELFTGKPFIYEINKDGFVLQCWAKDVQSEEKVKYEYSFILHKGNDGKP